MENASRHPPVVLTFLAPADRCNQACPECIIHQIGEPVTGWDLAPTDYATLVEELVEDGIPIRGINFQGYEVTLPRSWPYVDAVFKLAKERGIRRSFITNGMLLAKHTESIRQLDPSRISVSLDGADAETNDRFRGIQGAFLSTTRNLERFLTAAPEFLPRLAIASTLHDERNWQSLLRMPSRLEAWGISRWTLSVACRVNDGVQQPVLEPSHYGPWLLALQRAAEAHDVRFYCSDELGLLGDREPANGQSVTRSQLFDPDWIIRVEPTGHVRVGRELLRAWSPAHTRRWIPGRARIADVIKYPAIGSLAM